MANTDFEEKVLQKLNTIEGDVSWLKNDVSWLKKDVWSLKEDVSWLKKDVSSLHDKFDRLDDRVDDMESNLTQEIRMQGAYLNQAFDRMSFLQQNKQDKHSSRS